MKKLDLIVFASRLNRQGELRGAHAELFAVLDKWKSPVCVTPEAQVPLTLESKFRMTPIKS